MTGIPRRQVAGAGVRGEQFSVAMHGDPQPKVSRLTDFLRWLSYGECMAKGHGNPAAGSRKGLTAVPDRELMPVSTARAFHLSGCAMLLLAQAALAQQEAHEDPPPGAESFPVVVAEGRTFAVLGASDRTGSQPSSALSEVPAGPAARSFETTSQRIHVVEVDGEVYRAATPLDGPRSRIVFDPARRTFESLLPSIRLELGADVDVAAIGEAIGALRVTEFTRLGFAVLDLPADLHPADALAQVRRMPGRPEASARLRGPPLEWR